MTDLTSTLSKMSAMPTLTPVPMRNSYVGDSPGISPIFDSNIPNKMPTSAAPRDRNVL